jgi:hypothetical protein
MKKLLTSAVILFVLPFILTCQDITSELIGYWDFENIDNDYVYSVLGNNNHFQIVGSPDIVDGVIGNGMYFNGEDNYLFLPKKQEYSFNFTQQSFTLAAWAKPIRVNDHDGPDTGCQLDSPYLICSFRYHLNNRRLALYQSGSNMPSIGIPLDQAPSPDNWHLFVGVWAVDGNQATGYFYIDGCLKKKNVYTKLASSYPQTDMHIAATRHCGRSVNHSETYIDEVRIYNRALTQLDIAQLYIEGGGEMDPAMEINPKEIDFGEIPCNTDTSFTISFHNAGESVSSVYDINMQATKN